MYAIRSYYEQARKIQLSMLPVSPPMDSHIDLAAHQETASEVGGDYYDFFELPDNKLGFVIADVSGKGIQAAFIMAEIKGVFESLSRTINAPN